MWMQDIDVDTDTMIPSTAAAADSQQQGSRTRSSWLTAITRPVGAPTQGTQADPITKYLRYIFWCDWMLDDMKPRNGHAAQLVRVASRARSETAMFVHNLGTASVHSVPDAYGIRRSISDVEMCRHVQVIAHGSGLRHSV